MINPLWMGSSCSLDKRLHKADMKECPIIFQQPKPQIDNETGTIPRKNQIKPNLPILLSQNP